MICSYYQTLKICVVLMSQFSDKKMPKSILQLLCSLLKAFKYNLSEKYSSA